MKTPTPNQTLFQPKKNSRRLSKQTLLLAAVLAAMSGLPAQAASINKNSSTDALTLGTSWSGGNAPGANDIAVWDTGAFTTNSLGASTNWLGIQILSPSWPVTIANDGNTLTNGRSGIDLSLATKSLSLSNNVVLGTGPQNWTVASGQALALGGNLARVQGSGLRFYLPDLNASGAQVTLTNGTPNWMLGNTTNSTFGNVYFATINDMDIAALNGSMQVVGESTVGALQVNGIVQHNQPGATPTQNTNCLVEVFDNTGSYGARVSGSFTYSCMLFNTLQTYVITGTGGAIFYKGVPSWQLGHQSGRNITCYNILVTTNVGASAIFDSSASTTAAVGTTIIGTAGTRDLLLYQNNPAAPLVMQDVVTETGTNNPAFLNKFGAGTVELQANNTYSGGTRIYEGTLKVAVPGNESLFTTTVGGAEVPIVGSGTGSLGVSVRVPVSAFLGSTNSVNVYGGILAQAAPNTNVVPITVYSGATNDILIGAANQQIREGTSGLTETVLNSSTNFTLTFNSGSRLQFMYAVGVAPGAVAPLFVTNAYSAANLSLVANGTVTVDVLSGSLSAGTYPLITYSGSIGGTGGSAFVLGKIEPHCSASIVNNTANHSIDLSVGAVKQPLHWNGGTLNTWDINNSGNNVWNDNTGSATYYQEIADPLADNVSFDGVYESGTPTVTLNSQPVPSSVTFAGSLAYTLTGNGGISGPGSVTVSGPATTTIQTSNSFTGGLNLNGGILKFSTLTNLGAGAINFGGGTLQYNGNSDDISVRTVTFGAGGGTIDTAGQTVSYANAIGNSGAGGLTKAGSGTLTLNATNKYTGNTVVSAGTLALGATAYISNSAAIIVNSSAILDASAAGLSLGATAGQMLTGVGTVNGTVTAPAGTTISPASNGTIGTLALGNLTVSGGNLYLDVANTSSLDLISVGNLALNSGQVTINPTAGPLANGTYKLIQYSGSLTSGAGSSGNLVVNYSQTGKAITLKDSTAGEIDLVVVDNRNDGITWSGTGTSWDLVGTMDWFTNGTVTPWAFTNGDSVKFNDTGIGNTTVNLQTAVLPGAVTVSNNAATPYTFADGTGIGGGKIAGSTSVVKDGPGTLIMNIANTYSGATTIKTGTLQIGNGGIGDIGAGNVTNNGALIFGQGDSSTHTVSGAISGTGSLTKSGSATLVLAQNNTYGGATTIGTGTLQVGTGGTAGSLGTGLVTNNGLLFFNLKAPVSINNITGSGSVTFEPLTITLGNALTYQGSTLVTNGTLTLGGNNQIPNGATVAGSTGIFGLGGTLDLHGFNQTVNGLTDLGVGTGLITNSGASGINVLTVGIPSVNTTNTFSGLIMDNTNLAGIALVINNPGTTILTGQGSTYRGGTIVGQGTLQLGQGNPNINGGVSSGSGSITLSNGTTMLMGGNNITFVGNPVIVAPQSTVTLAEAAVAAGSDTYSGPISGDALSTIIIQGGIGNNFTVQNTVSQPGVPQWNGFSGTVLIPAGAGLRFYGVQGGTNTTFDIEGTGIMFSRDNTMITLGALTGNGSITTPSVTAGATYVIGSKGTDSTFIGSISGFNNIAKTGAGRLTLNGSTNLMVVTGPDEGGNYSTNYIMTNGLSFSGNVTVSNGVLAIVAPANLNGVNFSNFVFAGNAAVLDLSSMGSSPDGVALVTNSTLTLASPQTLTGIGTIRGRLVAGSGTRVSGGFQPNTNNSPVTGLLTVTNSVELGGAVFMNVSVTNTPNCTEISSPTITIDSGATLTVTNLGPENAGTFQLFNHGVNFTTVVLPALTGTNSWVNHLASDGSITLVAPSLVNPLPGVIQINFDAASGKLILSWPTNAGWILEAQTNSLATGFSNNWVVVQGSSSVTSITNTVNGTNGAVFYRMVSP